MSKQQLKLLTGVTLLAASAFLVYLPSLSGGFIMDDDLFVTDSPLVRAPEGLRLFWFSTLPADYWPLTNTTFWIEWRLWGLSPTGYHVTNLLLHIASALLIWTILSRLGIPGAWLAALLFAVHPVNVESVAWISQRKNVLSLLFFLLSILWYLKGETPARLGWYWLSLLAFTLAMLSKGSVATLPVVLLLLAWWQRGSVTKHDLARTAPFFMVAVVLAAVNVWFQTHGSGQPIRDLTFLERLLGAGAAVWFYLYKALVPLNLVFVYPQWNIQVTGWLWWVPLLAGVAVTALLLGQRNSQYPGAPGLLFAWLLFCVALAPVMGFTDVGFMKFSFVADRYLNIAVIAVVALLAAGLNRWRTMAKGPARHAAIAATVLVVGVLSLLARKQSALYADPIHLYQDTVVKNEDCWLAHYNLGTVLVSRGEYHKAIECFQATVRLNPEDVDAYNNLGAALYTVGRPQEAIENYQQGLLRKPDSAELHYNLANALAYVGRLSDAIEHYQKSLQLKPHKADARSALGVALFNSGQTLKAIEHLQAAAQLDPNSFSTQYYLGHALQQAGRVANAAEHYQQAVRLRPEHYQALNNLGSALASTGRPQDAIAYLEAALRIMPDYPAAHFNLGNALQETGHAQEAIQHYERALALQPDKYDLYAALANAYADLNRTEEAIATAQKALDLARTRGEQNQVEQIQDWLASYRSNSSQQQPVKAQPDAKAPPP